MMKLRPAISSESSNYTKYYSRPRIARTWKQLQLAALGAKANGDLLVPAGVDNHHLEEERLQKYACILFCDGVYENFHLLQTCD